MKGKEKGWNIRPPGYPVDTSGYLPTINTSSNPRISPAHHPLFRRAVSAVVQMSRTLLIFVYITTIEIDVNIDAIDVMIGIIVVPSLLNY